MDKNNDFDIVIANAVDIFDDEADEDRFDTLHITKEHTIDNEGYEYEDGMYDDDNDKYKGILKHLYFHYHRREFEDNDLLVIFQFKDATLVINVTAYDALAIEDLIDTMNCNHNVSLRTGFSYYMHTIGNLGDKERGVVAELLKEIKLSHREEDEWDD